MDAADALASGRAALESGDWEGARAAFAAALDDAETLEALHGLAEALWWKGDVGASLPIRERLYVAAREASEIDVAARAAIHLSIDHAANFGNGAAAGGWFRRAVRLYEGRDPGSMRGWLLLMRAWFADDRVQAEELLHEALTSARSVGDVDLELLALGDLGEALVTRGAVGEGLALVDEAMAETLACTQHRRDIVVYTCCTMLRACELADDIQRASQWCRLADDFTQRYGCPFLYTSCRVLYGGLLLNTGAWHDAERQLVAAVESSRDAHPAKHHDALIRLAELRFRQGRLEEAEALLAGCDDIGDGAPTLAAVHRSRGELHPAAVLLERYIARRDDSHLDTVPALGTLVEVCLAAGDLASAEAALGRLQRLQMLHDHPLATAHATLAAAQADCAAGRTDQAGSGFDDAAAHFSRLGLPWESARSRLLHARAIAGSAPDLACTEAEAAAAVFERLGASRDLDDAASMVRSLGGAARTGVRSGRPLTDREIEVLRLLAHGLSNPEIAERLVISRKTAAHHVSNVLAKLGVRNRAEAAAYATREGLAG